MKSSSGPVYHSTTYHHFSATVGADCCRTQLVFVTGDEIDQVEAVALAKAA